MSLRRSLFAVGGALIVVALAWITDTAIQSGEVARNTEIEGLAIGGLGDEELRRSLEAMAESTEARPLHVIAPTRSFEGTAGEWGVRLDVDSTLDKAMAIGRDDPLTSFTSWVTSWFSATQVTAVYTVDEEAVVAAVAGRPESVEHRPVDPSFQAVDGKLEVSNGTAGTELDPATVAVAVAAAVADGVIPDSVAVEWMATPPRFDAAVLENALLDAVDLTDKPISVRLNERTTVIPTETARRWIRSTTETGTLTATFDEAMVRDDLAIRLSTLASTENPPAFSVVDGELEVELGPPVLVCCEAPLASLVEAAARSGEIAELTARQRDVDGGQAIADAYGIGALVAEFTTNHACCGSRVSNIHRMADIVRGAIIEPGATFSINEFVGERTVEKGFLSAGAIEAGHLVQDVGGGVSQFATTLFNAAFFAGLDFADYQSHTIYFSRYPRGREATLGHPAPDLALTNNTPYSVLIWPEYTETSITVQLWSTPYFTVEQTGQSSSRWGTACTRYDTFRERTAPDGRVLEDSVFATYRPREGVDCLGNRIPPPRG
ncbi:MAG: VanW family protein [Acidimicrobiia bacterium]|nr:VanW family protein [Acidimicrobiia bacterium]